MVLGAVWKLNTPDVDEHLVQWHRAESTEYAQVQHEYEYVRSSLWPIATWTQNLIMAIPDSKDSQEHHGALVCQTRIGYQLEISQFLSAWLQLLANLGCLSVLATVQRSPVHHWHELMQPHACGDCISITLCIMIICKICFWRCRYFSF